LTRLHQVLTAKYLTHEKAWPTVQIMDHPCYVWLDIS